LKGLLSILFSVILLFSLCGYRLVIDVLQQKAQTAMAAQIDTGIDDEELISLKVPASLPYYTNSKDFQYISGEVQLDGAVYQYVKRRIYNDTIEYLCLQNPAKTKLLNAREQFYQLAYDLQLHKSKHGGQHTVIKPLLLEYCATGRLPVAHLVPLTSKRLYHYHLWPLAGLPVPAPAQPPERA
jgi:hypothetical protein